MGTLLATAMRLAKNSQTFQWLAVCAPTGFRFCLPMGIIMPAWQRRSSMETFKTASGLIRALVPVLYFGSLLYYFFDVSGGSIENANMLGLGPTLLGLGIVGLIFCIPLAIRIARILNGPRTPGSGGGPGRPAPDDDDGFDADAVVARYLAQRPAEAIPNAPSARPAPKDGGPATPTGFGRRIR
jgi:hypothetical protein